MPASKRPSWSAIAVVTGAIAVIVMTYNVPDSSHPETMRNAPLYFGSMLIAIVAFACSFALREIESSAPSMSTDASGARN